MVPTLQPFSPSSLGSKQNFESSSQPPQELPLLADFLLNNQNQADPVSCRPPVAPLQLQVRSLLHSVQPTLLVQVQVILAGKQSCQGAPVPQSQPFVSVVVPETPEVGHPEDAGPVQQPEDVVPYVVEMEE